MDAEKIAKGLTKAQREEILRLDSAWALSSKRMKTMPTDLVELGFVSRARSPSDPTIIGKVAVACLTPLGLAVRDVIARERV